MGPSQLTQRVWPLVSTPRLLWTLSWSDSPRQTLTLPLLLDLLLLRIPTRLRGNTSIALSSVCFPFSCRGFATCSDRARVWIGFFQGANPNNNQSIQSLFLSQEDIQKDCLKSFPEGAVPPEPPVDVLNKAYGGWHMNPTHVFFTDGQIDPWRTLSVGSIEENSPKRVGAISIPA